MSLVFCCCHAASSWMSIILDESARTELLTSKSICVIGEIVPAKVVQWDRVYPNPIHCQKKAFVRKLKLFPVLARALRLTKVNSMFSTRWLNMPCRMYNLYLQELTLPCSFWRSSGGSHFMIFHEGRRL